MIEYILALIDKFLDRNIQKKTLRDILNERQVKECVTHNIDMRKRKLHKTKKSITKIL
jgi:hypothetical protein